MKQTDPNRIRELLERIARVMAAEERSDELNSAQRGALDFLARANPFSRAPSNVADYMCTTRGTASQTLKALERKGFVTQGRSAFDRRSISYELTEKGRAVSNAPDVFDEALSALNAADAKALETHLENTARRALKARGFRSFGVCKTCRHHERTGDGRFCSLLELALTEENAEEICQEHEMEIG